eukprot:2732265-Pyramimonas_sp.AAC.1
MADGVDRNVLAELVDLGLDAHWAPSSRGRKVRRHPSAPPLPAPRGGDQWRHLMRIISDGL